MSDPPLVTVVVPCYNQERLIGPTLDSILAQDYPNFEVIVSDDASRDRTAEVAREYERNPWEKTSDLTHRPEAERNSDWMYYIELAQRGKVIYLPEALVRYRRHTGNLTSITDIRDEENVYALVERIYPAYQRSVDLGLTRLYMSYAVQYALCGRVRDSLRVAGRFMKGIVASPRQVPYAVRTLATMVRQRSILIARTGRIFR